MATALRIECDRMSITAELERTCTARIALLELAAECDIDRTGTDEELRFRIVTWILNAGARVRFLEGTNNVNVAHRIPNLEGQIRELTLDRNVWSDRALRAERIERQMSWLAAAVVLVLSGALVYLTYRLHHVIG